MRLTRRDRAIVFLALHENSNEVILPYDVVLRMMEEIDALRAEIAFLKDLAKGLQMGADSLRVSKELEKHDEPEKWDLKKARKDIMEEYYLEPEPTAAEKACDKAWEKNR